MLDSSIEILTTPHRDDLDLLRIANGSGLSVSVLPTGAIFAIEHTEANRRIVVNQTLALPIGNGMARLYLRTGRTSADDSVRDGSRDAASRRLLGRPLCLGGRTERRRPSRHPMAASAIKRVVLAGRNCQSPRRAAPMRRGSDPRSWARRSGLPDEQRGLRQPVSRPSRRAPSAPEPRFDGQAKPVAGRSVSVGSPRLSGRRGRLRYRFSATDGAGIS